MSITMIEGFEHNNTKNFLRAAGSATIASGRPDSASSDLPEAGLYYGRAFAPAGTATGFTLNPNPDADWSPVPKASGLEQGTISFWMKKFSIGSAFPQYAFVAMSSQEHDVAEKMFGLRFATSTRVDVVDKDNATVGYGYVGPSAWCHMQIAWAFDGERATSGKISAKMDGVLIADDVDVTMDGTLGSIGAISFGNEAGFIVSGTYLLGYDNVVVSDVYGDWTESTWQVLELEPSAMHVCTFTADSGDPIDRLVDSTGYVYASADGKICQGLYGYESSSLAIRAVKFTVTEGASSGPPEGRVLKLLSDGNPVAQSEAHDIGATTSLPSSIVYGQHPVTGRAWGLSFADFAFGIDGYTKKTSNYFVYQMSGEVLLGGTFSDQGQKRPPSLAWRQSNSLQAMQMSGKRPPLPRGGRR